MGLTLSSRAKRYVLRPPNSCGPELLPSFRVPPSGRLDMTEDAPDSDTYSGADGFGLFWSLTPEGSSNGSSDLDPSAVHKGDISTIILDRVGDFVSSQAVAWVGPVQTGTSGSS